MARGRELYEKVEPILLAGAWMLKRLPRKLVSGSYWIIQWVPGMPGYALRFMWGKALAKHMGRAAKIGPSTIIRSWEGISMGDYTAINEMCLIDAVGGITIGDNSGIGHHSSVLSFEHTWSDTTKSMREQPLIVKPIVIEDDVLVMAGTRVLCGRTIGRHSIVAANSVVTKDLPAHGIYGGLPAKRIGSMPMAEPSTSGSPTVS